MAAVREPLGHSISRVDVAAHLAYRVRRRHQAVELSGIPCSGRATRIARLPVMGISRVWLRLLFISSLFSLPATAQVARTGIVQVTVEESMGMVSGLTVRAAGRSASTDAQGHARLSLPVGRQILSVTGIGYKPARVTVIVVADSVVTVKVPVEMAGMVMEEVKVSATRIERLAGDTPTRVEVLDEMEVDENTLMAPSGISMLLNETPGLRVQTASPTLGTGSVRILGLPGQYTAMLADGLPLYGGAASALGPLDVSPVDLQRVEIIKGAASSLYGGQALGGVINLVSKPATGKSEVLFNRRTLGVTDAATWLSRRLNENVGASLLASGTVQTAFDRDHDGWADQARARRWNVRPRMTAVDSRGRSLFVTAGFGYDSREGGTLGGAVTPSGVAFRESLMSRRADVGARAIIPLHESAGVAFRFALSGNRRQREFGPGPIEDDGNTTGFLEVTHSAVASGATMLFGSTLQLDKFENSLNPRYDHSWWTPSLFATAERDVGPFTLSVSARGDAHPRAGNQFTERIAALAKPAEGWSVRLSAGNGFAPPTATTEETEAIGLRALRPGAELRRERSYGSMLDVNGQLAGAEVLVTAFGSIIDEAIQLADAGDGSREGILGNASGRTRIAGLESAAIWRFDGGKFLASYGYMKGSRPDAVSGVREALPLVPRHHVGGDLMFERPGVYRGGIEGIWYGEQSLDDNPFRNRSKPYLYLMAIAVRQFGGLELVANFENLLNVRQTATDRLVRPTPTTGGRWTTDVWAPLEGFMANIALRYRW
jgi:outer membrane receptor protein involved in Fe transport